MKKIFLTLSCLFISGFLFVFPQESVEKELLKQFHSISSHDLKEWVAEFSSDEFNGRLAGSPEGIKAAQWLADHLQEWGVKPAGDNGTYFQWFDIGYNETHELGSLCLHIKGEGEKVVRKCYSFLFLDTGFY